MRTFLALFSLAIHFSFATLIALPVQAETDNQILDESLASLGRAVGIQKNPSGLRKIKIAILDNGFRDFKEARGVSIPAATKLRAVPQPPPAKTERGHGLKMAEILSGLLESTEADYELHLFRSAGYTNFKFAIDTLIKERFDLALYAGVLEFAGQGDGGGFINPLVSKATANGVIWVNSTGNFAKSTYRKTIEHAADDWAVLPGPNNVVQLRCYKNETGTCHLRLVLNWNSFADDTTTGTDKDLDLILTDDTMKVIATGGVQQKKTMAPDEIGASLLPREIIEADLKPGVYYARVKIRSANFTTKDELRLLASGDFIEMLNRTEGETLLPPADNPSVITVGASDSDISSYSRALGRPELSTISLVKTVDGGQFKGSSNSAAAYAARIAVELTRNDAAGAAPLSREDVLAALGKTASRRPPSGARPTPAKGPIVGIEPTTASCYVFHALTLTKPYIRAMLREGGVVVDTTTGPKVFMDEEPFTRAARLGLTVDLKSTSNGKEKGRENSILIGDASGLYATSLRTRANLAQNTVEFVQTPKGANYCPLQSAP